jgi:hypothetical protein
MSELSSTIYDPTVCRVLSIITGAVVLFAVFIKRSGGNRVIGIKIDVVRKYGTEPLYNRDSIFHYC